PARTEAPQPAPCRFARCRGLYLGSSHPTATSFSFSWWASRASGSRSRARQPWSRRPLSPRGDISRSMRSWQPRSPRRSLATTVATGSGAQAASRWCGAMGASFSSTNRISSAPAASLNGTGPRPSSLAASSRCCVPGLPCLQGRHACRTAPSCSITRWAARLARGEYLWLHLTIGFAISLAGLWLFGAVTEDVIHHDPLTQFDVTLLEWLHARATPVGYAIFNAISLLGSPVALTILALGVGLVLASRRQWTLLAGWLAAFAGGGLLDAMLKLAIHRPRPPYATAFLRHYTWSFPSGHA